MLVCPKCGTNSGLDGSSTEDNVWQYECHVCGYKWKVVILKTTTIREKEGNENG